MSGYDKTLKLVTNLGRAEIEQRLGEIRGAAQSANLAGLVQLLTAIEGAPRSQLEHKVKSAVKWLADKPEHKGLMAQLELVEINLPNLK
jgi:hypothetical protein